MSEPIVFMLDVAAADAPEPADGWASTVRRVEAGAPSLFATDLAATRGDGVFETLGVLDGHPQAVDAHFWRLANSAEILELPEPNIDFALGTFTSAAGMSRGAGEAIFAVARTAGWIAHALEAYEAGTLLRPRACYTGR